MSGRQSRTCACGMCNVRVYGQRGRVPGSWVKGAFQTQLVPGYDGRREMNIVRSRDRSEASSEAGDPERRRASNVRGTEGDGRIVLGRLGDVLAEHVDRVVELRGSARAWQRPHRWDLNTCGYAVGDKAGHHQQPGTLAALGLAARVGLEAILRRVSPWQGSASDRERGTGCWGICLYWTTQHAATRP